MRHYFSGKVRGVLLAAVLLTVVWTVVGNLTDLKLPEMVVQGVLTPIRTGVSKLTDQAEQLYSYMFRYEALVAENAALKEQLAQMENDVRRVDALTRQVERYRQLLELTEDHTDYELVDAFIIGWSANDWTNTLTVNRGTGSGVEVGMCAVTANHEMVGIVVEAGVNYAVVRTILDPSLEVSATIAASGYNGIVKGNYVEGEKNLLRMEYLPTAAVIRNREYV